MNGGQLCLDGPTFISSEGWDWVPGIRDRNIGIWQDVHLRFTNGIRLHDTQVVTHLALPDTTVAEITVRTEVENLQPIAKQVSVDLNLEGKKGDSGSKPCTEGAENGCLYSGCSQDIGTEVSPFVVAE